MTDEEIIQAFTGWNGVPTAAIAAASVRRDELAPVFINLIERFVAMETDDQMADSIESPLFVIVPLLGEWRCHSAYRPVCRLLAVDGEILFELFGDAEEFLPRIVAALFDGDPKPILALILDADADGIIRSMMFDVLVLLAVAGRLDRTLVETFLRDAHVRLEPRQDDPVWDGWQNAVALLGLDELAPLAHEVFSSGWVPEFMTKVKHFEQALAYARAHPERPWEFERGFEPLPPTTELLAAFERGLTEDLDGLDTSRAERDWLPLLEDMPAVNLYRDVGRNDPCPCGSGLKFKKCCLGKVA